MFQTVKCLKKKKTGDTIGNRSQGNTEMQVSLEPFTSYGNNEISLSEPVSTDRHSLTNSVTVANAL